MNSSSGVSPARNLVDSVLKSSYSRRRIGITCPGTFWRTSGSSSVPRGAGVEAGSILRNLLNRAAARGELTYGRGIALKASGFQVFIQVGGWGTHPTPGTRARDLRARPLPG